MFAINLKIYVDQLGKRLKCFNEFVTLSYIGFIEGETDVNLRAIIKPLGGDDCIDGHHDKLVRVACLEKCLLNGLYLLFPVGCYTFGAV